MAKKRVKKKTTKRKVKSRKKNVIDKVEKDVKSALELENKHHWKPLIISLIIVYAIAFFGSSFTAPVVDTAWYQEIKPAITPPSWVFPVLWNILFFLIGVSLYLSWIHSKKTQKKIVAVEYGFNLFLNALWNFLFFGLKSPLYGFVALIFLWISILSMIYITWEINKKSSYLLIPYLLWVSFAGVLNFLILI